MIELYNEPSVKIPTFDDIRQMAEEGTLANPRIINPLINGTMKGVFTVGSAADGSSARIELDGTNQRIIINDGTYDRILLGYQQGGF